MRKPKNEEEYSGAFGIVAFIVGMLMLVPMFFVAKAVTIVMLILGICLLISAAAFLFAMISDDNLSIAFLFESKDKIKD